jgi:hypothetical protein
VLWIEEHNQYAMWALGDDEDGRRGERTREQGGLLVRADPIERASRLIEETCGAEQVQVSNGALMVATDTMRAGEINHKLVTSGVVVSELRLVEWFREETFLELSRREEI